MVKHKRKVAIIQAHIRSSRLAGKVMLDLCGMSVLERVLERTKSSKILDDVCLATSLDSADDIIELVGERNNVSIFRGSSKNVLDRYCGAAEKSKADIIIRVTADNPLTETTFIDYGCSVLEKNMLDYMGFKNIPYGSGVEVFTSEALFSSKEKTQDPSDEEHVTTFIKDHPEEFKISFINPPNNYLARPDLRVTIDTLEDYLNLYKAFSCLLDKGIKDIVLEEIIRYLDNVPVTNFH